MAVNLGWPCWLGVVAENLAEQRRFYRDVLGLRELAAGPGWVQFDACRSSQRSAPGWCLPPDATLIPDTQVPLPELRQLTRAFGPPLAIEITEEHR